MRKSIAKAAAALALALAMAAGLLPGARAMASPNLGSGAKIMRAEYQGKELSRDRRNPTVLEWSGEHVRLALVGNPACAAMAADMDAQVDALITGFSANGATELFDALGRAAYYIGLPSEMYVGDDVFEIFWQISYVTERTEDEARYGPIPGSQSPKYYVAFNLGGFGVEAPLGDAPAIVRAELNGVELSRDINKPTKIPYFCNIKLAGNSACKSREVDVQIWHNGVWTRTGQLVMFNSAALGPIRASVAYEFEGNNGSPLYNKTAKLEFAAHDGGDSASPPNSPAYYVIYQDEESALIDFAAAGLFKDMWLADGRLVVEVAQGYIFEDFDLVLWDKTANTKAVLEMKLANPDCSGILTNRATYSNLSLDEQHEYELTIPERAALFKTGMDPDAYNKLAFNKEHTARLVFGRPLGQQGADDGDGAGADAGADADGGAGADAGADDGDGAGAGDGALSFPDVPDGHWAHPYVGELAKKGVIEGYEDGTFRPDGLVTRNEFAKIMALSLGMPLAGGAAQTFADVGVGDWAFAYVETVKPYLTGYSDGALYYFKGSEPAVREDMAVALVKAMGLEDQDVDLGMLEAIFQDHGSISPNLRKYVLIAHENGLIDGYPDGTFRAQGTITRAETAALLVKVRKSDAMEKVVF